MAAALPLSGRVAIVTGASRGIGREVALHLASLGANLIINYVASTTPAELLADEITNNNNTPSRAIAVKADVSDPAAVKSLFDRAEEAFASPAHILVVCAGVLDPNYPPLAATPDSSWDSCFDVNAKGAFLCCREAANRLARGGGGRIVTFSSSLVGTLLPGYAAYAASQAAVEAMTRILAKELRGTAITANCVAPGPVATEMFFAGKSEEWVRRSAEVSPMGRLGETKDVAPVVGFLCTDAAEWVNGQVTKVDIQYDKLSKQVDVHALKDMLWNQIQESIQKFAVGDESRTISLKHVLSEAASSKDGDISPHLFLICLLHLANEHCLSIHDRPSLDDLDIHVPASALVK